MLAGTDGDGAGMGGGEGALGGWRVAWCGMRALSSLLFAWLGRGPWVEGGEVDTAHGWGVRAGTCMLGRACDLLYGLRL